jgi:hypothetical protein
MRFLKLILPVGEALRCEPDAHSPDRCTPVDDKINLFPHAQLPNLLKSVHLTGLLTLIVVPVNRRETYQNPFS